jgi:hypothetical protein
VQGGVEVHPPTVREVFLSESYLQWHYKNALPYGNADVEILGEDVRAVPHWRLFGPTG